MSKNARIYFAFALLILMLSAIAGCVALAVGGHVFLGVFGGLLSIVLGRATIRVVMKGAR